MFSFLSFFFLLKAKEQTYFANSVSSLPLLNITFYGGKGSVILGLWFSSFSSSFHSEWHMDSRKAEARGGKEREGPSWLLLRWLSSYLGSWCTLCWAAVISALEVHLLPPPPSQDLPLNWLLHPTQGSGCSTCNPGALWSIKQLVVGEVCLSLSAPTSTSAILLPSLGLESP